MHICSDADWIEGVHPLHQEAPHPAVALLDTPYYALIQCTLQMIPQTRCHACRVFGGSTHSPAKAMEAAATAAMVDWTSLLGSCACVKQQKLILNTFQTTERQIGSAYKTCTFRSQTASTKHGDLSLHRKASAVCFKSIFQLHSDV